MTIVETAKSRHWFIGCVSFALLLAVPKSLLAAAPAVPVAAEQQAAVVEVIDVDGRTFSGRLIELADGRLSVADPPNSFQTTELLRLEFRGRQRPERLSGPAVYLANGDRLMLDPRSTTEEHLTALWKVTGGEEIVIPLETIRAVVFETDGANGGSLAADSTAPMPADILVFRNGDRLAGEFVSMTPEQVTAQGPVGKVTADRSALKTLLFDPELISFPKPKDGTRQALLMLTDGTRVTADRIELADDGTLSVEAAFGGTLALPLSKIVSVRFLGGRAVYVSDLKPLKYRFTPFLSTTWPLRRDANVLGGPLALRGREYPKGLGVYSRSEVTYELRGRYRQFRATVGIDDVAQGGGSVVFAVELDGRRVFTSDPVTGRDDPIEIPPVDVAQKQQLTLIVEFGHRGDIRDYADWCDPILIR